MNISGIYAAIQGLFGFQKKVEASAHTIANVDTDGFKRTRVTLQDQAPYGVEPRVETIDTPGTVVVEQTPAGNVPVEKSNVDLARELTELQYNQHLYEANLKSLQTQMDLEDTVLDIKT